MAAVIGHPVRHSRSPAILNAAFEAAGLDWAFVAFEVPRGRAVEALTGVRALGIAGLSVTMPHKEAVAEAVDELDPDAAALGAVNCVQVVDGSLLGRNTDGPGFVASVRADAGLDPRGLRCGVLGAGGAARAVARSLAGAGAAEVVVVGRTPERAERAAALAGSVGRTGAAEELAEVALVVNATPVGMGEGSAELPLAASLLGPHQVVVDLVYHPRETALLAAARQRGARAVDGLGMLVHQAAVAFTHWTGREAPVEVMRRAAETG